MLKIDIQYRDDTIERVAKITKGDWIDLRAADEHHLKKGEFKLIDLGVAMKLPKGYEALLAPRGSTFKHYKMLQTNSVGVVDNSYSGPNDWWRMPVYATEDIVIPKGERICQFRIIENQPEIEFNECKLDGEDRGGFGSTGKK